MLITKEYKKRSWLAKTFFCADTINYVPTLSPPCGRLSCAGHINAANNYREFGTGASFWSATESERDNTLAHFRYLFYIRAEMYGNTYGMGYGFSVQCAAYTIKFEDGAWLRLFYDGTVGLREGKR